MVMCENMPSVAVSASHHGVPGLSLASRASATNHSITRLASSITHSRENRSPSCVLHFFIASVVPAPTLP